MIYSLFDFPFHVGHHTTKSLPQVCAARVLTVLLSSQFLLPFSSGMENELVIASLCESVEDALCHSRFLGLFFLT